MLTLIVKKRVFRFPEDGATGSCEQNAGPLSLLSSPPLLVGCGCDSFVTEPSSLFGEREKRVGRAPTPSFRLQSPSCYFLSLSCPPPASLMGKGTRLS